MPGIKEIKILYAFYLIVLATCTMSCQNNTSTDLIKINTLSNTVHEVSGITCLGKDHLYVINDSGNKNLLYRLDQKGSILDKIKLPDTENLDWEDLAYDTQNNIYVGDFGNNNNKRKDLMIYRVGGVLNKDISVEKIWFSLEDQKKFPPKKKNFNYDIEAFIHLNNHLYLFTKNRSSKFEGTTKLYKLPASPGKHVAKLIGTYRTCKDNADCFVTGATVNRSGDTIVLLTYNKLFVLSDFKGDDLFGGSIQKIKLNHYSQKEGVCFKNDSTLYITNEKTKHHKATLYEYPLSK